MVKGCFHAKLATCLREQNIIITYLLYLSTIIFNIYINNNIFTVFHAAVYYIYSTVY